MVCEYSQGPKFADVEVSMRNNAEELAKLSTDSLQQVENDEAAYAKLREAFATPKDSPERPLAIQTAAKAAVEPATNTLDIADKIFNITLEVIDGANINLISDI